MSRRGLAAIAGAFSLLLGGVALADDADTSITRGPSGLNTARNPVFEFSSGVAGATFECSLDSPELVPCSSPYTAPDVEPGEHLFKVRAVAPDGRVDATPAARYWRRVVDVEPPRISLTSPPGRVARRATLRRLAGLAVAASGITKVEVALRYGGSELPELGPQICVFVDLGTSALRRRPCLLPLYEDAVVQPDGSWRVALPRGFARAVKPGRIRVQVRAFNGVGVADVWLKWVRLRR